MENRVLCLEQNGSGEDDRGISLEHMFGYVDDEGKLYLEVDNYFPMPQEAWDPEEWEEHKCFMEAPASRVYWEFLYRVARSLVRCGEVTIDRGDKPALRVACDGTILMIE